MSDVLTVFGFDLLQLAHDLAFPVAIAAVVLAIVIGEWERGGSLQ